MTISKVQRFVVLKFAQCSPQHVVLVLFDALIPRRQAGCEYTVKVLDDKEPAEFQPREVSKRLPTDHWLFSGKKAKL